MRVFALPLAGLVFMLPAAALFAQASLPAELLRPRHGEAPRFPKDYQIGEIGRGEAGEEAYQAALRILRGLAAGGSGEQPPRIKETLEILRDLETRHIRIGGGRNEADGSVSFLVRFLGREEAVAGECYLRRGGETEEWRLDDIVLDRREPLGEGLYSPKNAISIHYDPLL